MPTSHMQVGKVSFDVPHWVSHVMPPPPAIVNSIKRKPVKLPSSRIPRKAPKLSDETPPSIDDMPRLESTSPSSAQPSSDTITSTSSTPISLPSLLDNHPYLVQVTGPTYEQIKTKALSLVRSLFQTYNPPERVHPIFLHLSI